VRWVMCEGVRLLRTPWARSWALVAALEMDVPAAIRALASQAAD
jgi:hypothetical protein